MNNSLRMQMSYTTQEPIHRKGRMRFWERSPLNHASQGAVTPARRDVH